MELFLRNRTWWCDFTQDGVRHRVSTKERVRARAKTVADDLRQRARSGRPTAQTKTQSVAAYAERFLEHINATQLDKDTKRYYATGIRLLKATPIYAKALTAVSNADCAATHFPHSGSNANCALRTLRRLLSLAAEQRVIDAAPRIHLRKEKSRTALISNELEGQILTFARQPFRDAFLIMQDSGMRPDEVVRLQWEDVLWDRSMIHVREGKTRKATRFVPLSDRVKSALRVRAQGALPLWVFESVRKGKGGVRSHIRPAGLSKEWGRLRRLLKIDLDIVMYSSRHTFGTDLMDRVQGNIVLVSDVLGHADMKITRRYIHPSTAGLADLINTRNGENEQRHKARHKVS